MAAADITAVLSACGVPLMKSERQLAAALNLTVDNVRLGIAFIGAIVCGFIVRCITSPTGRNLFSAVTGFLLLLYPFGGQVLHGVVAAKVTYLLMWLYPRKCGSLAWSNVFPYLIAFHIWNASGMSGVTGPVSFTGAQMLLTFKLISMSVCYQDGHTKTHKALSKYQQAHCFHNLPTLLEVLGFAFAFGNLLGGPMIEFKDYQMWVNQQGPWRKGLGPRNVHRQLLHQQWKGDLKAALGALWTASLSLLIYLSLGGVWNPSLLLTHWYHDLPVVGKLLTISVIAVVVRCSAYFQWSLGHCSLALAGLDFKGWSAYSSSSSSSSSKPLKGAWGRCKNASPLKLELCPSSRLLPMYWNTTTGNFLRRYVYEHLTAPGVKPTFRTLLATELVCALWHGVYPGYIMFFAGGAVMFAHSTVIYKYERAYLPTWFTSSWPWWAVRVVLTKICIDFLITAFALRSLRACVAVWASVRYLPLGFMVVVCCLGSIFPARQPETEQQLGQVAELAECMQQQQPAGDVHANEMQTQPAQSWGIVVSDANKARLSANTNAAVLSRQRSSHLHNSPAGSKQD